MTEADTHEADPQAEGFKQPPPLVTMPCRTYMARTIELRKLVGFYFSFVKTSHEFTKLIPAEAQPVADKAAMVLSYNYSEQRPLMNQIMLSRAIESFDLYLSTIVRDIFLARPEMLKSEGTIDIAAIVDAGNYNDIVGLIADRKVHDLSYKPLSDLRKFIDTRTGIDLFPDQKAFEMTLIASEIRNLIAHNDCVISDQFKRRTKGVSMPLEVSEKGKITLDDQWLRRASYALDGVVFRFDQLVAAKFSLKTAAPTAEAS